MKDEPCPSPQRKQGWRLTLLTLRARTLTLHPSSFILHPSSFLKFLSACTIRWNTSSQSPHCRCRNKRAVGYHGLSSRSSSQRQSGTKVTNTQTGTPRAPAQWATAESTVMTRSRFFMTAAVSMNVSNRLPRSVTVKWPATPGNCSVPAPFCKLNNRTSGNRASAAKRSNGTERYRSRACFGSPCQEMPIFSGEW